MPNLNLLEKFLKYTKENFPDEDGKFNISVWFDNQNNQYCPFGHWFANVYSKENNCVFLTNANQEKSYWFPYSKDLGSGEMLVRQLFGITSDDFGKIFSDSKIKSKKEFIENLEKFLEDFKRRLLTN